MKLRKAAGKALLDLDDPSDDDSDYLCSDSEYDNSEGAELDGGLWVVEEEGQESGEDDDGEEEELGQESLQDSASEDGAAVSGSEEEEQQHDDSGDGEETVLEEVEGSASTIDHDAGYQTEDERQKEDEDEGDEQPVVVAAPSFNPFSLLDSEGEESDPEGDDVDSEEEGGPGAGVDEEVDDDDAGPAGPSCSGQQGGGEVGLVASSCAGARRRRQRKRQQQRRRQRQRQRSASETEAGAGGTGTDPYRLQPGAEEPDESGECRQDAQPVSEAEESDRLGDQPALDLVASSTVQMAMADFGDPGVGGRPLAQEFLQQAFDVQMEVQMQRLEDLENELTCLDPWHIIETEQLPAEEEEEVSEASEPSPEGSCIPAALIFTPSSLLLYSEEQREEEAGDDGGSDEEGGPGAGVEEAEDEEGECAREEEEDGGAGESAGPSCSGRQGADDVSPAPGSAGSRRRKRQRDLLGESEAEAEAAAAGAAGSASCHLRWGSAPEAEGAAERHHQRGSSPPASDDPLDDDESEQPDHPPAPAATARPSDQLARIMSHMDRALNLCEHMREFMCRLLEQERQERLQEERRQESELSEQRLADMLDTSDEVGAVDEEGRESEEGDGEEADESDVEEGEEDEVPATDEEDSESGCFAECWLCYGEGRIAGRGPQRAASSGSHSHSSGSSSGSDSGHGQVVGCADDRSAATGLEGVPASSSYSSSPASTAPAIPDDDDSSGQRHPGGGEHGGQGDGSGSQGGSGSRAGGGSGACAHCGGDCSRVGCCGGAAASASAAAAVSAAAAAAGAGSASSAGGPEEELVAPCRVCAGGLRYIHRRCLARWLESSWAIACPNCRTMYDSSVLDSLLDAAAPSAVRAMLEASLPPGHDPRVACPPGTQVLFCVGGTVELSMACGGVTATELLRRVRLVVDDMATQGPDGGLGLMREDGSPLELPSFDVTALVLVLPGEPQVVERTGEGEQQGISTTSSNASSGSSSSDAAAESDLERVQALSVQAERDMTSFQETVDLRRLERVIGMLTAGRSFNPGFRAPRFGSVDISDIDPYAELLYRGSTAGTRTRTSEAGGEAVGGRAGGSRYRQGARGNMVTSLRPFHRTQVDSSPLLDADLQRELGRLRDLDDDPLGFVAHDELPPQATPQPQPTPQLHVRTGMGGPSVLRLPSVPDRSLQRAEQQRRRADLVAQQRQQQRHAGGSRGHQGSMAGPPRSGGGRRR